MVLGPGGTGGQTEFVRVDGVEGEVSEVTTLNETGLSGSSGVWEE